nr:hypothetical protein [Natranaerobius thermophilus]
MCRVKWRTTTRIGVIRALTAEPPIILMDEPFGALISITREQLQDELLKLLKRLFS